MLCFSTELWGKLNFVTMHGLPSSDYAQRGNIRLEMPIYWYSLIQLEKKTRLLTYCNVSNSVEYIKSYKVKSLRRRPSRFRWAQWTGSVSGPWRPCRSWWPDSTLPPWSWGCWSNRTPACTADSSPAWPAVAARRSMSCCRCCCGCWEGGRSGRWSCWWRRTRRCSRRRRMCTCSWIRQ